MAIDPTTPIGKVRLRIGDWQDLSILPDSVIQSALDDNNGSVNQASSLCAQYILGTLTAKTHRKLAQLESWSGEQFTNYVQFLEMTILNPNFSGLAPIPYAPVLCENPILKQAREWKEGYLPGAVVLPYGNGYDGQVLNPSPIITPTPS